MKRPSVQALDHKIRCARSLVGKRRVAVVDPASLVSDALKLGYSIGTELFDVLKTLLLKCKPEDFTEETSHRQAVPQDMAGLDVLVFEVEVGRFLYAVRLEFVLASDTLWLVSLHENRIGMEAYGHHELPQGPRCDDKGSTENRS